MVSGSTGTRLAAGKPELCRSEHIAGSQATIAARFTCWVTQRAAACLTEAAADTAAAPGGEERATVGLALLDGLAVARCREVIQIVPAVTPAAATTSTSAATTVARHRRPRRCAHNRIVEASTEPQAGSALGDRAGGRAPAAPGRAPAGRGCGPVDPASRSAPGGMAEAGPRRDGGAASAESGRERRLAGVSVDSAGERRLAGVSGESAEEGRLAGVSPARPSVRRASAGD